MAGARIDHASRNHARERMVKAGLIAGDARRDFAGAALLGLVHEIRVGEKRPGHGDQIGAAFAQNLLRGFRIVDPVGRHYRNADLADQFLGDPRECSPRHSRRDRGNCRLVPADARVDDVPLRPLPTALASSTTSYQMEPSGTRSGIESLNMIRKSSPTAFRERSIHFQGQTHPVRVGAAPAVGALVRSLNNKLVQKSSLRIP